MGRSTPEADRRALCDRRRQARLEYIVTYVRHQEKSTNLLRTFADDWFAFAKGAPFLNGQGNPHWFNNPCPVKHCDALNAMHFVSHQADNVLKRRSDDRLVKDHAVPVLMLHNRLMMARPATADEVEQFLIENYRVGVITHAQHGLLPVNDATNDDRLSGDAWWLDRYTRAGIVSRADQ